MEYRKSENCLQFSSVRNYDRGDGKLETNVLFEAITFSNNTKLYRNCAFTLFFNNDSDKKNMSSFSK